MGLLLNTSHYIQILAKYIYNYGSYEGWIRHFCLQCSESDNDNVHFLLDQHIKLNFYSASSRKQQSAGRCVTPLGHIILISSQSESSKYQFYSPWLDATGAQIHNLRHSTKQQVKYYMILWLIIHVSMTLLEVSLSCLHFSLEWAVWFFK